MRQPMPIPESLARDEGRFWASVDKSGGPNACWPYRAGGDPYARFKSGGRTYLAHRVAHALSTGSTLNGTVVRHSCDNPPCCNPAHLLPGTYSDNTRDMLGRGRANPRRGDRHPRSMIDDDAVAVIRGGRLSGRKTAELLGVSYGTVANIRAGRTRNVA